MVDWPVPFRAASSGCDKPARGRAERRLPQIPEPTPHTSVNGSWLHGENYCHAVTLCVYFNNFTRIERTWAVASAIAAGITDEVLHEVGCAALMNANQAPALRGPYKKRVTEIEISKLRHSPILRLEKNKTASDESRNFAD